MSGNIAPHVSRHPPSSNLITSHLFRLNLSSPQFHSPSLLMLNALRCLKLAWFNARIWFLLRHILPACSRMGHAASFMLLFGLDCWNKTDSHTKAKLPVSARTFWKLTIAASLTHRNTKCIHVFQKKAPMYIHCTAECVQKPWSSVERFKIMVKDSAVYTGAGPENV